MQNLSTLRNHLEKLEVLKTKIVLQWIDFSDVRNILSHHDIDKKLFIFKYANNIFEYFINVIKGAVKIGACPVMANLLIYLKDKDITTQELFIICSHFKLVMIDIFFDMQMDSKILLDEINYVFDRNFVSVLRQYSQTIYEKDIEIDKNVKLLEQYMEALNQSALISKTDEDGNITLINDKFIQLCGYNKKELIGKTHKIMRDKNTPDSFYKKLWTTIKKNKTFRAIIKNRKKNGGYFYIDTTIVTIENPFTQLKEYIAIGYEVTKLIDAKQKAIDADKTKDYFLSNMSHEIRTPLNAILGFVTLLQDELLSKKHKNYLDIIYESGENLLNLINDILDVSKLRGGEFTIEAKSFNPQEILSRTIELFVAWANKKDINISCYIDPLMPSKILSDPLRIQQIISNFISNAIKFTPNSGAIEINATVTQNDILSIIVKDSGIGISDKNADKIFKPFFQMQSDGNISQGTGLGLSICKQLAKLLDGTITLSSKQNKGSIFTLKIPVHIIDNASFISKCKLLKKKKIALLVIGKKIDKKLLLLKKYYKQIGIKLFITHDIDNSNYDLLYFLDSNLDDAIRYQIIRSNKVAICITKIDDNNYDSIINITNLNFPIYCQKIKDVALNALNIQDKNNIQPDIIFKANKKFRAHVLIAEDNEANQELIKMILKKYNITYDIVSNGLDALKKFKKYNYHLIFMDEQMPQKSGYETVKEIIAFEKQLNKKHTPIIALTANVTNSTNMRNMQSICDEFLGKPIVLQTLQKIFIKYLQQEDDIINLSNLKQELQLNKVELEILLRLYIKKMDKSLQFLKRAIKKLKFKKIVKLSHSIKGASANFRIYEIQNSASELEDAAQRADKEFNYKIIFTKINLTYKKVKDNLDNHSI